MNTLSLSDLWSRITALPTAEFLVRPDRVFTYGELADQMSGFLALFDARSVRRGDRILIVCANEIVAISAFLAGLLDGVVPVMLTHDTAVERIEGIWSSTKPALVVTDAQRFIGTWNADAIAVAPYGRRKPSLFGRSRGATGIDLPPSTRAPTLPQALDELAYLLFTSGTTQAPSGVMLSRGNVLANLATLSRLFSYSPASRIYNDMILAHGDGLVQGPLLSVVNGCALIRQGGYSLPSQEAWLNGVRATRATHVITVPTVWAMIDRYAAHDDYFDAPECVALLSVAARLDADLWQRLENRFKRPVFNQYGLTETVASALYAGSHPEMGAFGTIGVPVDCEARTQAPQGGTGELLLKGSNIFMGYWQNPDRTAASFTADGWMRTGDLAEQRPDGSFQILGRLKSVIMSGGFLIRPEEVDEALLRHPAIAQAVTVAIPDPEWEEVPMAVVVLDRAVSEAELTTHCRSLLEPLKVPKRIIAVEAVPRGDAGKPQIAAVRAILEKAIAPPAGPLSGAGASRQQAVLNVAAQVFRADPASLTPAMGPQDVAGWDSFSQISLVFAMEARFGISIPPSKVAGIRTLADLIAITEIA